MDFRFYAVVALVIAIMEIASRIAKKGQEREDSGSADPRAGGGLLRRMEEIVLSAEADEPPSRRGGAERAVVARPRVEPRNRAARPAPQPRVRARVGGGDSGRASNRPSLGEAFFRSLQSLAQEEPVPSLQRAPELQVVAGDRRGTQRDEGEADVGRESRRTALPTGVGRESSGDQQAKREAVPHRSGIGTDPSGTLHPRLPGLYSTRGLRRFVVAREVLGPPLALREEERRRRNR